MSLIKCSSCGNVMEAPTKSSGTTCLVAAVVGFFAILVLTALIGMLAAIGIPSIVGAQAKAQEKAMARNLQDLEAAKGMCELPASVGGIGATDGQQLTEEQVLYFLDGCNSLSDLNIGEASLDKNDLIVGTPASYED